MDSPLKSKEANRKPNKEVFCLSEAVVCSIFFLLLLFFQFLSSAVVEHRHIFLVFGGFSMGFNFLSFFPHGMPFFGVFCICCWCPPSDTDDSRIVCRLVVLEKCVYNRLLILS